jgi:hypothetical protein
VRLAGLQLSSFHCLANFIVDSVYAMPSLI